MSKHDFWAHLCNFDIFICIAFCLFVRLSICLSVCRLSIWTGPKIGGKNSFQHISFAESPCIVISLRLMILAGGLTSRAPLGQNQGDTISPTHCPHCTDDFPVMHSYLYWCYTEVRAYFIVSTVLLHSSAKSQLTSCIFASTPFQSDKSYRYLTRLASETFDMHFNTFCHCLHS